MSEDGILKDNISVSSRRMDNLKFLIQLIIIILSPYIILLGLSIIQNELTNQFNWFFNNNSVIPVRVLLLPIYL